MNSLCTHDKYLISFKSISLFPSSLFFFFLWEINNNSFLTVETSEWIVKSEMHFHAGFALELWRQCKRLNFIAVSRNDQSYGVWGTKLWKIDEKRCDREISRNERK